MTRAVSLVLALTLLASSSPLPVIAEDAISPAETASSTGPVVEEEMASVDSTEEIGEGGNEEGGAPMLFQALAAEAPPALEEGEQYLINQDDASHDIVFDGASGGSEHNLLPRPVYVAENSGLASKVRMYLARKVPDGGLPGGRTWSLTVFHGTTNDPVCNLVGGIENHPQASSRENFDVLPTGDASNVALVEFNEWLGDCFLYKGNEYSFQLQYRVNGGSDTNGTLYTKGANSVSEFFLQVIGDTPTPPPPPEVRPGERLLINQFLTTHSIVFEGAAGGTQDHILRPAPVFTALGSGPVSRVRLSIAKNRVNHNEPNFDNRLDINLYVPGTGERICTLLSAWKRLPGQTQDNYNLIPTGGPFDTALVEFTNPVSDCVLEEGTQYEARLSYLVNGDPRWTNGIIYLDGADSESEFFLQVLADDGAPLCTENCFSSVLFLPGILGSRLSENGQQRWEPSSESDVTALYFGPDGMSQSADIQATEVIGTFDSPSPLPDTDIYQSFLSDLSELQSNGDIAGFAAAPYDWRQSIPDVIAEGSIEATLRSLAAQSYTGKVTIVAHSNGGLVTKALLNELGPEASALVDKVIFVGVPQLGTPQAIGALLHGYETGLPFDWLPLILSPERARDLGRNMPMTYQLLPHADYYDNVGASIGTPLISFEDGEATSLFYDAYGGTITNNDELRNFLLGSEGREVPDYDDLENPARLRAGQIADAEALMQSIGSSWVAPEGIEVHQIAGVGEETLAGIHYKTVSECKIPLVVAGNLVCLKKETKLSYEPNEVIDGDGTVVTPSALLMSDSTEGVERWWLNLDLYNRFLGIPNTSIARKNHGTIFQIEEVRSFIFDNLVTTKNTELPDYIFNSEPDILRGNHLRFVLHSPLDLSVEDENGNKLGKNQAEIQDASFKRYGEVQVIHVPANAAPKVILSGVADGSFTLDVEEYDGAVKVAGTSFSGIPSLATTQATMEFPDGTIANAGELVVDYEGDGTVDLTLAPVPGEVIEPGGDSLLDTLTALKQAITQLSAPQKTKDKLLKRVAALEAKIEKKKEKNQIALDKLAEKIAKKAGKGKIAAQDAEALIALIETLELGMEDVSLDPETLAVLKASIESLVAPDALKQNLLKRVAKIENIQGLTRTLSNFSTSIVKNGEKGKITDSEVQSLLDLLALTETAI